MAPAAAAAKERRAEAQHHARLRSAKLHESQHFCKAGDQDRADKLAAEVIQVGALFSFLDAVSAQILGVRFRRVRSMLNASTTQRGVMS